MSAKTERPRRRRTFTGKTVTPQHDAPALIVEREIVIDERAAEGRELVAHLAALYARQIKYYSTRDDAARSEVEDHRAWLREQAATTPTREIDWRHIDSVMEFDAPAALAIWERVKDAARDELVSGSRVAHAGNGRASPFERAQFLVLREQFIDGWQPQGGIEYAMVEMLAQAFSLWLYWTQVAHERALNTADEQRERIDGMKSAGWRAPFQSTADAIEQAHRLADGHNRQFLRVVRQLRDLRRYSVPPPAPPVIVNQPGGQVNVANNQLNVAKG